MFISTLQLFNLPENLEDRAARATPANMHRLDRYILREMLVPFLIGLGAVVLMLTGTVLYNNADTFLNYGIPASGVARIALYFLPYLVHLTMPVAVAIATSLTVARLARDTEITVMRAAGISLKRIFLPVFAAGALLSVVDFYFGEKVVPLATAAYERTMSSLSRNIRFLTPQAGQAIQSPDKRYTVWIGRMELGQQGHTARLHDVRLLVDPGGPSPTIILAENADYNNGVWTLHDAKLHIYRNGGTEETFVAAKKQQINFRLTEQTFNLIALQLPLYSSASTISFAELRKSLQQQRRAGWVNPRDLLDFHFKLSVPFSCLVFAIACPPLALRFARSGNFMGVLLSIVLVFVYWNMLLAAKILGARYPAAFPPMVAGWSQNILFSLAGLYFLWREE